MDLNDLAKYLLEGLRQFEEKKITAQELMARKATASAVIRIGELKVRVATLLQQTPKDAAKLLTFS